MTNTKRIFFKILASSILVFVSLFFGCSLPMVGEVSEPIQTEQGYYIIFRTDGSQTLVTKVPGGFKPLIKQSSDQITDLKHNGTIDFDELVAVSISVKNKGKSVANHVAIKFWGVDETTGNIVVPENIDIIDNVLPGEIRQVLSILKIPHTVSKNNIIIKSIAEVVNENTEATQMRVKIQGNEERTLLHEIVSGVSQDKCKDYLSKYPHSYYADAVNNVLDDLMWEEAKSLNSMDSYQKYYADRCKAGRIGKYCDQSHDNIMHLQSDLEISSKIINANENNVLNAGELVGLMVSIKNAGKRKAEDVSVQISSSNKEGLIIKQTKKSVGNIEPGQKRDTCFSIKVAKNVADGRSTISIVVSEKNFINPQLSQATAVLKSAGPEKKLYLSVQRNANLKQCFRYLTDFPNGNYLNAVLDICEAPIWRSAVRADKIEIYSRYRKLYPDTENSIIAMKKIVAIQAIKAAQKTDTFEAYLLFLKNYPNSKWAPEAERRTSLPYWQKRFRNKSNDSHVLCQVAKASVTREGELAHSKALKYYTMAGDTETAFLGIAEIKLAEKRYVDAMQYLKRALKKGYNSHKIYYLLGRVYENLDQTKKAIVSYNMAIQQNPDSMEYYYAVALLYRENLDYKKADQNFRKVIEQSPKSQLAKSAREYLKTH